MLAAVIKAEKEERKKIQFAQNTILGYDTQKWVEADAVIRDEVQLEVSYQKINFVTATKGNHRFARWQKQYEDVHNFLSSRKWAPVQPETEVSGITWIELFVLFDITGTRSADAMHQKKPSCNSKGGQKEGSTKASNGKRWESTKQHSRSETNAG